MHPRGTCFSPVRGNFPSLVLGQIHQIIHLTKTRLSPFHNGENRMLLSLLVFEKDRFIDDMSSQRKRKNVEKVSKRWKIENLA